MDFKRLTFVVLFFSSILAYLVFASTSTLVPAPSQHIVTSGAFTTDTNTHVISTQAEVTTTCYGQINASDDSVCLEDEGSATKDAYFLVNFTLPSGTYQSVYVTAEFRTTAANDACHLGLWNFTSGAFVDVNTTGAGCSSASDTTLNFNVTNAALGNFVSGGIIRVLPHLSGGSADDINVDFVRAIVNFNGSVWFNSTQTNTTKVYIGNNVSHLTNVSTSGTLAGYNFEWNATGASCDSGFQNVTNGTLSGTNALVNVTQIIPTACAGRVVGWRIYANNTDGVTNSTALQSYQVYKLGFLNVSVILPASQSTNVSQNGTFNITARVFCDGGAGTDCGSVSGLARYNDTGEPNVAINTTLGGLPFYVSSSGYSVDPSFLTSWHSVSTQGADAEGITVNGTHLWLVNETQKTIRKYLLNTSFVDFINITNYTSPNGVTQNGSLLFLVGDSVPPFVHKFYFNGTYAGNISLPSGAWWGIANNRTHLYVAKDSGSNYNLTIFDIKTDSVVRSMILSGIGTGRGIDIYDDFIWVMNADVGYILFRFLLNGTAEGNFTLNMTKDVESIAFDPISLGTFYAGDTGFDTNSRGSIDKYMFGANNLQSCGSMENSQTCELNWTVNATGAQGTGWNIDVSFNSTLAGVSQNDTANRQVNISGGAPPPPTSVAFTLFIPAGNETGTLSNTTGNASVGIIFNLTGMPNALKANASSVDGSQQTSSVAIFRFRNDGNVAINITLALDAVPTCANPVGTIVTKAGWSDASWESSCTAENLTVTGACVNITTTPRRIANLTANGYTRDVWLWADIQNCGGTDTTKTLTHNSTQS